MARPPGMSAEEYRRFQETSRRTSTRARTEARAASQGRTASRRAPSSSGGLAARLGIRTIPGRLNSPTRAPARNARTSGS